VCGQNTAIVAMLCCCTGCERSETAVGRAVEYDFGDLDELSLAFVLSIHKSQGSEFPCVVIPLHTQHYLMLQRNLLYTAVTRGKKLVVMVGSKKALGMAVRRTDTSQRHTTLRKRLHEAQRFD
jgi:exodeoxyribonuclease V alpha subunit